MCAVLSLLYMGLQRIRHDWATYTYMHSRVRLCDAVNCSLPGSSVHRILQARILEWDTIPFSRKSSQPRDQTCVSCVFCISEILYPLNHLRSPLIIYTSLLMKQVTSVRWNSHYHWKVMVWKYLKRDVPVWCVSDVDYVVVRWKGEH